MESVISDISLPLISRPTWAITVGPLRSDNSPTLSSLVPFFSGLHIYGRLSRARSIYIEDCLFKSERDERAQKGVGRGYAWRPGKIQQSSQVNENHIRLDIPYSHRITELWVDGSPNRAHAWGSVGEREGIDRLWLAIDFEVDSLTTCVDD